MRRKHWPRKSGLGLGLGIGGGGIAYEVNDQFLDTDPAPIASPRNCTPGPGVMTTVDTGGLQSVGSGILTSSAAATGDANPVNTWGEFARAAGRTMIAKFKTLSTGASAGPIFGWFTSASPATWAANEGGIGLATGHRFYYNAAGARALDQDTAIKDYYYSHSMILASAGMFYLSDADGCWLLRYRETVGTTATLYPGRSASAAGRYETSIDDFKLPVQLRCPQPVIADNFSGTWPTTNGGGLTGLEAGGSSKTWVANVGSWGITGGKAVGVTAGGIAIATVDGGKPGLWYSAALTRAGGELGVVCNYVDANNYVRVYHDGTNVCCESIIGGVAADVFADTAKAYSAGANLAVRVFGIEYFVFYNNAYINCGTVYNTALRASSKYGLYSTNDSNSFDNVLGFPSGTGNEYDYHNSHITYSDILRYRPSIPYLLGMGVSYDGTPDNYTVTSGTGALNGKYFTYDGTAGVHPEPVLTVAGSSLKNPFIYEEGGTYYMFYSIWVDGGNVLTDSRVGYATSPDLINWTHQGDVIDVGDLVGFTGTWAPKIWKIGSTYYMFIAGSDGAIKMAYLTSSSLTSGYTWQGILKDDAAADIAGLDPFIFEESGTYYMVYGNFPGTDIKMYSSLDVSANSWTLVGTLLSSVGEAPYIIKDNGIYYLFWGTGDSSVGQRICIATASAITGPYTKQGYSDARPLILLDSPEIATGPISAPALAEVNGNYYLFVCTGTAASGNNAQQIVGYSRGDNFSKWKPLKTSVALVVSANNLLYINPSGQLIHSVVNPFYPGDAATTHGWMKLGTLAVDASSQVTGFTP